MHIEVLFMALFLGFLLLLTHSLVASTDMVLYLIVLLGMGLRTQLRSSDMDNKMESLRVK